MRKRNMLEALGFLLTLFSFFLYASTALAMKEENGVCKDFILADIPIVENDGNWHMPEDSMRITQTYNNLLVEGSDAYCIVGNATPSWDSEACKEAEIFYRHTGNDFHRYGGKNGEDNVYAISNALVIASQINADHRGWGESVVYAFRINRFSSEIVTASAHHMHKEDGVTSRTVSACDSVEKGYVIGLVGDTGDGPTHVHVNLRVWANLQELIEAIGSRGDKLFGKGYANSDENYLPDGGYREPVGFLYNEFRDYKKDGNGIMTPYQLEMWPYVRNMLTLGIDTGLFDGRFGTGEVLKRGEAARWIKVAAMLSDVSVSAPTYVDVDQGHKAFPYVEALSRYPDGEDTVLNPDANVYNGQRYFYPDVEITRAQALKMVILAFYADEYQKFYFSYFWATQALNAGIKLADLLGIAESELFQDFGLGEWFASYVYYGALKGFVKTGVANFRPNDPIHREEMAKWIILGRSNIISMNEHACSQIVCQVDEYCDYEYVQCVPKATCVPSEIQECEVGGGYDPCAENPACAAGQVETQECGYGGTQSRTCSGECEWGEWGTCTGSGSCYPGQIQSCGNCGTMTCQTTYEWGTCQNQGVCAAGQTQNQTCNDTGTQTRTCTSSCQWGGWSACSVQCQCTNASLPCCDGCNYYSSSYICDGEDVYRCAGPNPGQDAQKAVVNTYCSGTSSSCNGGTTQSPWTTYSNCSSSQVCEMDGDMAQCVPYQTCSDVYLASTSKACYTSAGTQYGYNVCLEVQQVSGASWKYRVCRNSGSFADAIKYRLYDLNHLSTDLGGSYTEGAGLSCSSWRSFSVGHITTYGSSGGAGLQAEIITPHTCTAGMCKYNTGMITIRKECQ